MVRSIYIAEYQEDIVFEFVELVEKQKLEAQKNGKKGKSYSQILVDYMDYYVKNNKKK